MTCRECREWLCELPATGPGALPHAGMEEHVAGCRRCRERHAALVGAAEGFERRRRAAAEVHPARLAALQARVLTEVAREERSKASPEGRRTPLPEFDWRAWAWGAAGAVACAAALAWAAVWAVDHVQRHQAEARARLTAPALTRAATPMSGKDNARQYRESEPAAGDGHRLAVVPRDGVGLPSPAAPFPTTARGVRKELDRLKATPQGVSRQFLLDVQAFARASTAKGTERAVRALLVADTYDAMGESDAALAAFEHYLDVVEETKGKPAAALMADARAAEMFFSRSSYFRALSYYDLVLARYPDSLVGRRARLMVALHYEKQRMWSEALAAYELAAAELGQDFYGIRARKKALEMLGIMERPEDAIRGWQRLIQDMPSVEDARVHLLLGDLHRRLGSPGLASALREYRTVVERYPAHSLALAARNRLREMAAQTVADMETTMRN